MTEQHGDAPETAEQRPNVQGAVQGSERPRYEPSIVEPKWQAYWDEHETFKSERHEGRPKIYILDMFPYPSGSGLHVGHPEGYTATDIVARFKRMNGFDVLHPMGWDAFGLPAEQHAIRTGTHPRATTASNILTFKRQLKSLGFSYDWSREIDTTDPKYVKWTQWIFLQFFKKGLAFQQSDRPVNWCPELGTVLANDEVTSEGKSEVGGFPVEKLKIRQWSLAITKYADRLLEDLKDLDWPETRAKQAHWIGRSEGANVEFAIKNSPEKITVFTTRVDTLPGATYVVLAPEHALAQKIATANLVAEVKRYSDEANAKTDIVRSDTTREKTGVPTGAFAINPINGDEVPIWVGDYVIGSYGSGAVMAVPAHDERDHAFALKYELPIVQVVWPTDGHAIDVSKEAFCDDGIANDTAIQKSQAPLPKGTTSENARRLVTDWLVSQKVGSSKITYKLRDWVFSRQRYWGEPIPIYFPVDFPAGKQADPRLGAEYTIRYDQPIAVEESELPLLLPDLEDFKPGTDPAGPLARAKDWRFFQKDGPENKGRWFARETNTMPQWAGSCWYYLRFTDPLNDKEAWSEKAYADWMPVDLYVGGSEHTVLHLLYARFWQKVLFDLGLVKDKEPFTKLVHQGLILGEDAQKMSKSRGNVVNPDDVIKKSGADALRLYEMFMGPLEAVKPWQTSGIEGVRRFLDRLWNVCENVSDTQPDDETKRLLHKTIQKVTGDIEAMRFNTAISSMMILVKHLGQLKSTPRLVAEAFVLIASPFAPHIGEELWQKLGHEESLAQAPWPKFDAALVKDDVVEIGVQVNGKVRGAISIAVDANQETALAAANAQEKIAQMLAGKAVAKIIYVPGKILNVIVKG
ncbi:MAG: leucine--tRNA ligase [Polyangiaceae bacterium]